MTRLFMTVAMVVVPAASALPKWRGSETSIEAGYQSHRAYVDRYERRPTG